MAPALARRRLARAPLMMIAVVSLVTGLWAGLARAGVVAAGSGLLVAHGPLMVNGFLGTLIGLERAVGLGRRWGYAAPVLFAAGVLASLALPGTPWGILLSAAGALGLAAIFVALLAQRASLPLATMGVGAALLVGAQAALLLRGGVAAAVPWWIGFLVLTIAGERLELTHLFQRSRAVMAAFVAASAGVVLGAAASWASPELGARVLGVALVALSAWLLLYDLARNTVRVAGLPRYMALALLAGYAWLAAAGATWALAGHLAGGFAYDAVLHMAFLGFVLSMVFAHAPIILPAVLHVPQRFHVALYAPLSLLHISLLARVAGDAVASAAWRAAGATGGAIALVLFFATFAAVTIGLVRRR